jgi:hypothetical protein
MKFSVKKLAVMLFLFCFISGINAFAGTNSPARDALKKKDYNNVIKLLSDQDEKSAEEFYLLGQAYYTSGNRKMARESWNETIQIAKQLPKKGRWNFLFPPGKKLTKKQKKKRYDNFKSTFSQLKASGIRTAKNKAKDAKREAVRKDIEAKKLTKKANAATEAINSKNRVAERQSRSNRGRSPRRSSGAMGFIALILIIIIIVAVVMFIRRRRDDDFEAAGFGTNRYDVDYDDGYFSSGPFWYKGRYYHSQNHYHNEFGSYYSNRMYMDNYDSYGMGQGRDHELDNEIMENIEERQDMREEAADLEAEADLLEQDAEEALEEADELEKSGEVLDEEPEFEDDDDDEVEEEEDDDDEDFEDDE